MEPKFWHEKWKEKELGFNQTQPNPLMVKHFESLGLSKAQRVFLPLCGKTIDIHWLLEQGYQVVGAELSETAVIQLFEELDLEAEVTELKVLKRYSAPNIEILVGNIFSVTASDLGSVDATYDRAAMVALPQATRKEYAAHLIDITGKAPQLLITFTYDQSQMSGPPFSIPGEEIERHYGLKYQIQELEVRDVEGKLKGQVEATEIIRLLTVS